MGSGPANKSVIKNQSSSLMKNKSHLPTNPATNSVMPSAGSRDVVPIEVKYKDLNSKSFSFKDHFIPAAVILLFSIFLSVYALNQKEIKKTERRGVAGNLNDLSNGSYEAQSATYIEDKTCVDHPDGTKTCTTQTRIRREFR